MTMGFLREWSCIGCAVKWVKHIGHMSSVVKPGAVRIGTTGYTANGITYSAFENTDGTYAFVLANNNADAKRITVSDGTHYFSYEVPAKAVVSYRWKK